MVSEARSRTIACIAIIAISALAIGLSAQNSLLSEVESRSWDWRLRMPGVLEYPDQRISIILLDQQSLEFGAKNFGVYWPWPRQMYEAVLHFLKSAGAKGVAFDILFTERSSENIEDDHDFIEAVRDGPGVVSAVVANRDKFEKGNEDLENFLSRQRNLALKSELISDLLRSSMIETYSSATIPFKELLEVTPYFGNVTASPDSDGVFRHLTAISSISDAAILPLPFALIDSAGAYTKIDWSHYLDQQGRLAVRFTGKAGSYRSYHISDIIQSFANITQGTAPLIDPQLFKNNFVFVGMSAPGLLDLRPVPLDERFPGVEFNATIADNLLNGNFIKRPAEWFAPLSAFVISVVVCVTVFFVPTLNLQLGLLLGLFILSIGTAIIGTYFNYWLPLVLPATGFFGSLLGSYGYLYQREGKQHRFIRSAFKQYLSPEVIEQIVQNPKVLALGGERRELTIFFADIAGFTSISETLPAQRLAELLNRFLSEMTSIILSYGGTLDKYVGDAIIAFWNAPLPTENHATQAVRAAIACQKRLAQMRADFERDFAASIKMRIGIHTGIVSVGNFGSKDRFAYTVVGDAANLASRIEGVNKVFGTEILISDATYQKLDRSIDCRRVATIRVVGRKEPLSVFEPLGEHSTIGVSDREQFARALAFLEHGKTTEAIRIFDQFPEDPVCRAYSSRFLTPSGDSTSSAIWELASK